MIHTLSIDLETRSGADLKKTGVYRYTEDQDFSILLFGYSADGGPVKVIDVTQGEPIPEEILQAIVSKETVKWAFNATFERICLSAWLRKHRPDLFSGYGDETDSTRNYLSPESWHCSMVWAATLGLPLSLESVGSILKLQDQKMTEGKSLIRFFSVPCRPTASNGHRTWNNPTDDPQKWQTFKAYNKRDVEVEMAIQDKLKNFPVSENIWEEYHLSETINDRGIRLDTELAQNAIAMDARAREELSAEMQALTEIDNPNSAAQMKQWLKEHGLDTETLDKKAVKELIRTAPEGAEKAPPPAAAAGEIQRTEIHCHGKLRLCRRPLPRHVPVLRRKPLRPMGRQAGPAAEPAPEQNAGPERSKETGKTGRLRYAPAPLRRRSGYPEPADPHGIHPGRGHEIHRQRLFRRRSPGPQLPGRGAMAHGRIPQRRGHLLQKRQRHVQSTGRKAWNQRTPSAERENRGARLYRRRAAGTDQSRRKTDRTNYDRRSPLGRNRMGFARRTDRSGNQRGYHL